MRETVLDVLMYLFENVITDEEEFHINDKKVIANLERAGFLDSEIQRALTWLDELIDLEEKIEDFKPVSNAPMRIFTPRETDKLDVECQGMLIYLEQVGVIDVPSREIIIDRLMALEEINITIEEVKWVTLLVLFNRPGLEAERAWMEDFVYDAYRLLH